MAKSLTSDSLMSRIDSVLTKHGLKKTHLRRSILLAFSMAKKPLTQAELIASLEGELQDRKQTPSANLVPRANTIDRVSVYRNLSNLKDSGVLHEVDSNNYVFCSHECEDHAHLLLYCQKCHKHQEIKDHASINGFMSALGSLRFFGQQQPIFLRGVCRSCT